MNIANIVTRVLVPRASGRVTPGHWPDCLIVSAPMLEEHVIDFDRFSPVKRPIDPDDTLRINDIVLAFSDNYWARKNLGQAALYHPRLPAPGWQGVGLGGNTVALRLETLAQAVSALAAIVYRLTHTNRPLSFIEIKNLELRLLDEKEVQLVLDLTKRVHSIRASQRQSAQILGQLVPATLHKIFTNGATEEVKDWLQT